MSTTEIIYEEKPNELVWDDENFGPTQIVDEIIKILDPEKDKVVIMILNNFLKTMGYAAPEMYDMRFWGANYDWKTSFTNICKTYLNKNIEANKVFESAVKKYQEIGF